jgi:hypothetical protein
VISALNIFRDYSYAEITEIRRDRRENFKSRQGLLFVPSQINVFTISTMICFTVSKLDRQVKKAHAEPGSFCLVWM